MTIRVLLPVLFLLLSNVGFAGTARVTGTVRIENPNNYNITILVQRVNTFGVLIWKESAVVNGRYRIELNDVPEGALLGFRKSEDPSVTWPPIEVLFPRQGRKIADLTYSIPSR